jgi:hypothetical protein
MLLFLLLFLLVSFVFRTAKVEMLIQKTKLFLLKFTKTHKINI